jgi:hypothetical protein
MALILGYNDLPIFPKKLCNSGYKRIVSEPKGKTFKFREPSQWRARMSFSGKTVLISGGACGMGRATAELFAQRQANVVIVDIDIQGQKVAKTLVQHGLECSFKQWDVS